MTNIVGERTLSGALLMRFVVDALAREIVAYALTELAGFVATWERQQALAALDGEDYLRALTASPAR